MSRETASTWLHKLLIAVALIPTILYTIELRDHREERSRFSLALEAVDAGRWYWNLETGEIFWDERMYELFGKSKDFPLNYESFIGMLHPDDQEKAKTHINQAIAERGKYQDVFRVITDSGEIVEVRAAGMVDRRGKFMTGINLPAIQRQGNFILRSTRRIWEGAGQAEGASDALPPVIYGDPSYLVDG